MSLSISKNIYILRMLVKVTKTDFNYTVCSEVNGNMLI